MSHRISLDPGGESFDCRTDQSVLDAALGAGIVISYGCRSGLCGSCKGKLLQGRVDYPGGLPDALSTREVEQGYALFCKSRPVSDLSISIKVHPKQQSIEVKTLPVKVEQIERLSARVIRLVIQLPASEAFDYIAGQWIYFLLKNGQKRAYSIANGPRGGNYLELHLAQLSGGQFSDFVFEQLKPGVLLRINGPHGTFTYEHADEPVILVAGGTGFAPIKAILETLLAAERTAPLHLFCGAERKAELYQRALIPDLLDDPRLGIDEVVSSAGADDGWRGRIGQVHEAVLEQYPDLSGQRVYMAGPPAMIHRAEREFIDAGISPEDLIFESFELAERS